MPVAAVAQPDPAPETTRKAPPMVRVDNELLAKLDAWVAELQQRDGAFGTVTRSDVVRAILAKRLRDRKPGELP